MSVKTLLLDKVTFTGIGSTSTYLIFWGDTIWTPNADDIMEGVKVLLLVVVVMMVMVTAMMVTL